MPNRDTAAILGAAIDDAPVCVFVADAEMRYVAVNRHACEVLGYSEPELLAMHVPEVAIQEEAPTEYSELVDAAYRRGASRLRCKDGEEVVLEFVAGEVSVGDERLFVAVGTIAFDG